MNRVEFRQNRQKKRWIAFILAMMLIPSIHAQVDYSARSNILNPDTLRGDRKKVFWHFVKLTHDEVESLKPEQIKSGFAEIGITTDQNDRFVDAFSFYFATMTSHKKSCEQWESFKDLKPEYED